MTTLTLPIVVGKKYVRRDGVVIEAKMAQDAEGYKYRRLLNTDPGSEPSPKNTVDIETGKVWPRQDLQFDLVSDYIEPAKGHPHAGLIALFAQDAAETETPWDRWEFLQSGGSWVGCGRGISFDSRVEYRRKPTVTPDPHAENAAEYAKDMAETDEAWERWEFRHPDGCSWVPLICHPSWISDFLYRRKEQA